MEHKKIKVGDIFTTNEGYTVEVIGYIDLSNVCVKFDDGNEANVFISNLRRGILKNKNHKNVSSVGYVGYGKHTHTNSKKAYQVWCDMLIRCYSKNFQVRRPTYIGCSVVEEWYNFQVFAKWYYENYIDGFQLDKDLVNKGNKIYSPNNCSFLPCEINTGLQINKNKKTNLPIGVSKIKDKYASRCKTEINYNQITFNTIEEAISHYNKTKESYIKRLAEKHKQKLSEKSYNSLICWTV